MSETKQGNPSKKQNASKAKPRLIVIREYCGKQNMQTAFEQVIEKRASDQFEQWMESKAS
ncbi:hypothetical protein A7X67_06425 [Clostridium sp. W14A]|nr:hypothetical protein A7X67_06425 [Clostridium sp. W14A]